MMEALVAAAVHAIALSMLLGAALFALVFAVVRAVALRAAVRHLLWTAALLATAAMPLASLGVSVERALQSRDAAATAIVAPDVRAGSIAGKHAAARSASAHGATPGGGAAAGAQQRATASPGNAANGRFAFAAPQLRVTRLAALALVTVWLGGALAGFAGLLASVLRVRGLKKRSSPLDGALADDLPWLTENRAHEREIYLRLSDEIETPVAVGFRRPVILIPTQLATASGLAAIEQLVRHEHAHLRRYDDWTNLVQRIIERIFWFNPIVWFVGARIALEREIASDDAVVDETGRAQEYATSLWRLAREMRMPEHAVVAPGALLTRKQISIRIESLLESRSSVPALTPLAAAGVGISALLCVAAAATSAPALELPLSPQPAGNALAAGSVQPAPLPNHPATFVVRTTTLKPLAVAAAGGNAQNRRIIVETHTDAVNVRAPEKGAVQQQSAQHAAQKDSSRAAVRRPGFAAAPAAGAAVVAMSQTPADAASAPPPPQPPARISKKIRQPLPPEAEAKLAELPGVISRNVADAMREAADAMQGGDGKHVVRVAAVPADADPSTLAQMLARCTGCSLAGRNLRGVDLRNVRLTGINLSGADLREAKLDGVKFVGVNLSGARLDGASLAGASFIGSAIGGMTLRGANLSGVTMTGVSLSNADLRGLDVRSLLNSCTGCNLAGTNLHNADLHGIHLVGGNFAGADLSGANLIDAVLDGANFSNANLQGANLRNASFTGASFAGSDVRGAVITGARFEGADLKGLQFP